MKKFLFLIILILPFVCNQHLLSRDIPLPELGGGWAISGGFDVQGKVIECLLEHQPTINPTTAWVYCEGEGFCMDVDASGVIHIDCLIGLDPDVESGTLPNPPKSNQKTASKN